MPKLYRRLPPLDVDPAVGDALDRYAATTGVPKARIRREVLFRFLEPYINDPGLTERLQKAEASKAAERAAEN